MKLWVIQNRLVLAFLLVFWGGTSHGEPDVQISNAAYFTIYDESIDGVPDSVETIESAPFGHLGFVCNCNAALGGVPWVDITFVDFDLSSVAEPIVSAILNFTSVRTGNGAFGRPIHVSSYGANGVGELSDFNANRDFIETITNPSALGTSQLSVDVTDAVNSVIGQVTHVGFAFTTSGTNSQLFIAPVPTLGETGSFPTLDITFQEEVTLRYISHTDLADLSGDGIPEVAVLRQDQDARPQVVIKDGATKEKINTIGFHSRDWTAKSVSARDYDNNGIDDIAVLAVNPTTNQTKIQIRDSLTKELVNTIWFQKGR